jgi:peptide deformylase
VRGYDRHGKPLHLRVNGWVARIFQHEIDHLNGVLFTDKAVNIQRVPLELAAEMDRV